MRILFASTSGLGHLQPMVPLAQELQVRGHDVHWTTAADGVRRLAHLGFDASDVGLTGEQRMTEYLRQFPEARDLRGEERVQHMFPRMFGAVAAPAALPALRRVVTDFRPEAVVHEAGDFAAPAVAAVAGIPNITHGFGLALPPARVEETAMHAAPVWDALGAAPRPYGGCYDHLYIDIYPPSLHDGDAVPPAPIQRSQPLAGDAAAGDCLPDDLVRVLTRRDRPALYLTFGTIFNRNEVFADAVAAVAALDAITVVTVGPTGDADAFGATPDHVHVAQYLPQSLVLPHVDAVVSHAGSGTLLAALGRGLPQVCLPQAADQFRNAKACARVGAGIALVAPDADGISQAVSSVLGDPAFARRAGAVATEIASMPPTSEVAAAVERIAQAA